MTGRVLRALAVALVSMGLALAPVDPSAWSSALIALALLAGLPHGALDHRLAALLPGGRGLSAQTSFHVAYLVAVAGVLVGWWFAPAAGLLLLLLSAIWHFGESDLLHVTGAHRDPVLVLTRGAVVVALPLLARPDVAAELFQSLAGTGGRPVPTPLAGAGLATAVFAAHLLAVLRSVPIDRLGGVLLDATALGLLGVGAGPVLGFAIYFVFWHTPDHFLAVADRAGAADGPRLWRAALPRTAIGGIGLLGLVLWVDPSQWARLVVWGVAALTLPHAMIVHFAFDEARPRTQEAL